MQSNAGNGSQVVQLGGLWQSLSENNQEPSLSSRSHARSGIGTNIPTDLNANGHVEAVGRRGPLAVLVPARHHQAGDRAAARGYHTLPATGRRSAGTTRAATTYHDLTQHEHPDGQTVAAAAEERLDDAARGRAAGRRRTRPRRSASRSTASGATRRSTATPQTSPTAAWSRAATTSASSPPATATGVAIPDTYLLMMDYSGINYDYNDNTYLITNIRPETLPTPQGVAASAGNGRVTLSWSPSSDPDVRYRVSGATPTPTSPPTTPHRVSGADPLNATSFTDTGVTNGTTYYYMVRAVIPARRTPPRPQRSRRRRTSPRAFAQKVNFQSAAAPVPAGYLRDYGQAFGARSGADQGSGLVVRLADRVRWAAARPVGRWHHERRQRPRPQPGLRPAARHLHAHAGHGRAQLQRHGRRRSVGDGGAQRAVRRDGRRRRRAANTDPEIHTLRVEGTSAISGFVPSGGNGSATHHATATVTVTVADGRLTLDAIGGTNTKIDYVDIAAVG